MMLADFARARIFRLIRGDDYRDVSLPMIFCHQPTITRQNAFRDDFFLAPIFRPIYNFKRRRTRKPLIFASSGLKFSNAPLLMPLI